MKGYFFEGNMELTKEWVCKKVDYLYQEHLGISTLLLIKKVWRVKTSKLKVSMH